MLSHFALFKHTAAQQTPGSKTLGGAVRRHARAQGFSLLELLIALSILSFMAVFSVESLQRATRSKVKMQAKMDYSAQAQDALEIMARDISLAFNHWDTDTRIYNAAQKARYARDLKEAQKKAKSKPPPKKNGAPNKPNTPPKVGGGPQGALAQQVQLPRREDYPVKTLPERVTHFKGGADSVHFTSLSYVRRFNVGEFASRQAEVGFFIKRCKEHAKCLWRRTGPVIDAELEQGGTARPLLGGVEEFSLRYLVPGEQSEWIENWDSTSEDQRTKGLFPQAVQIQLSIAPFSASVNPQQKSLIRFNKVVQIKFAPPEPKLAFGGTQNLGASGQGEQTLSGAPPSGPEGGGGAAQ